MLVRPGNVTNVFHINVIVVGQNFLGKEHTSLSPSYSQISFFNHYQSMF